MASEFLRELHAGFAVAESALNDFVNRSTGSRPVNRERIMQGYDNEVYRVRLGSGVDIYVRIRIAGAADFTGELQAMDLAREVGVPVPAVLAVGTVETGRPAMIVAAARGRPLSDVAERRPALESLGRTLHLLHSVPMPGYWRPDADNHWQHDAAEQHRAFVADRADERDCLMQAGIPAGEIDRMIAAISAPPPPGGPVLLHCDPSPDHIYVDSAGEVVDLIDWGMWCGGSPIGDLAYVARTYGRDELDAVLAGHGDTLADPAFRRQLWSSVIGLGIGHVAHHVRIGDTAGAQRNARGLTEALSELIHR